MMFLRSGNNSARILSIAFLRLLTSSLKLLKPFKAEVSGSNKRYSFRIAAEDNGRDLHVFESAIDLMSYASMRRYRGQDWKQEALLSLAGVFQVKRKGVLPVALEGFLEEHPEVKTIHLHLDNDQVGQAASKGIIESLEKDYEILDQPPRYGKDMNEALRIWLQKQQGCSLGKE